MWSAIFRFELRYHLRQPLLYLVTFVLSVLLFTAGTGDGPGSAVGALHLNAPAVILQNLVKGVYLVLFLMTAFVVSAAVRDFDRRTAELFLSKPITRVDYITARFAGAMVVCALPYVVGTIALAVSAFMPWLDAARVGDFSLAPYAFGLGVLILPTLVALGAAFSALANWTRSTIATYVGVVAFVALSAVASLAASNGETRWIAQLLDPFGITALGGTLRYWTVAELNTHTPAIGGMLLWNRLLWLGIGFGTFAISIVRFDPSRTRRSGSRVPETAGTSVAPARTAATRRTFTWRTTATQFAQRVAREALTVFRTLPFLGALALGLVVLIQAANEAGNLFGMPVHPRTPQMLEALQGAYSIVLLLVVVLYSGELIWKERALELDEMHDAMPVPSGVYLGAKLTALLLVIAAYLLVGVVVLIGFQLMSGYREIELGLYLRGVAMAAVYPALMLVLACCCHVFVRNKLVGYGCVLLFIVAWDLLEELGFEHHLTRFASLPSAPYSDFNGYGPFAAAFGWFAMYWTWFAVVLVGLAVLFWKRGTDGAWRARVAEARLRFRGATRGVIAVGAVGFATTGAWIYYNTNVQNRYAPSTVLAARRANYERVYRQYERAELPRITAVRANVDIFPLERRVRVRGTYALRNQSTQPQRDVHISMPERAHLDRISLAAHAVALQDDTLGYRILRLRTPLAPGDTITLGFDVTMESRGFVNNDMNTAVVSNGTYFTKRDVFPVIGYDAHRQLEDADVRREQDLEAIVHFAAATDTAALRHSPRAPDADRVAFDVTVSTNVDQIAVTSGALMREWTEGRRRHFRYVAEAPITHHFAFVSARYAMSRRVWNGVAIEVYHHPRHGANVGRMLDAAAIALTYGSSNFGPYQHPYLRIVEYPRYERDATSFPGMIAMSESMGFNARLDEQVAIDFPFYVTAHEVAHQWWGQQLVAANVQGAAVLHETLAQYTALMVAERELGRERTQRVLAFEHDQYLRGRSSERGVEPTLARAEREDYVYYHKGALAMYALREAIGEAPLNGVLSRLLARFAQQGPPYPTVNELLVELRSVVPAEAAHLVDDLFERKVRFNNAIAAATGTARADGSYFVRVEISAHKSLTDSAGVDREVPLDDFTDVVVFGEGARADSVLVRDRRPVRTSTSVFEFVTSQRPGRVVLDPSHLLIDRDRADNARRVEVGASPTPPTTSSPSARPVR